MRLIDGEYLYNKFVANKCPDSLVLKMVEDEPTVNAIPIPDGATNGDMIKLVFNAEDIGLDYFRNQWGVHMADGYDRYFNLDWWNAPYNPPKQNLAPADKSGLEYADQPTLQSAT